jgi:hypothetical protein
MRIAVATSSHPSAESAMAEVSAALPPRADFVACYFAERYGADAVRRAAAARLRPGAFHAGTSCRSVMTAGGLGSARHGLGCFAITDPAGDYGSALARKGDDPARAAREATRQALLSAGRAGEAPELVWLTATPGGEEEIIAGIEQVVGTNTPVIGGSAADDGIAGHWRVAGADGVAEDGLVVSVLFPSTSVAFAFHSGYAPAARSGTVTRAEGRRIHTIDDQPAVDIYAGWTGRAEWLGHDAGRLPVLAEATFAPFGRVVHSVSGVPYHLLAHPAALNPDGSVEVFATVDEGETVCLMTGSADSLAARAGRVARHARLSQRACRQVAGALVVYCGGCMLAVEDRLDDVTGGIEDALGPAPFLGIFTFGEQGSMVDGLNRHGNLMISCVVFGA